MPRGIPNSKPPATIIEIPQRGGVLGRIDRMYQRKRMEAEALGITLRLLDEDLRAEALASFDGKIKHAIGQTNGRRALMASNGDGHHEQRPKKKAPAKKAPTMAIHGKRLTLFLLEFAEEAAYRTRAEFEARLAELGSPISSGRAINGILTGALPRFGYLKVGKDGSVRRTAAGTRYAADLRAALERKGQIGENYRATTA